MRIVCPFISVGGARNLLKRGKPSTLEIITRFNLDDFAAEVSDISALRLLRRRQALKSAASRICHAKLYLIGCGHVILTSANLANGALRRNHELNRRRGPGNIQSMRLIFRRSLA